MTEFAVWIEGARDEEAARRATLAAEAARPGAALAGAYWTAQDGTLLCVFEGEPAGDGAPALPLTPFSLQDLQPQAAPAPDPRLKLVLVRTPVPGLGWDEVRALLLGGVMCGFEYPEMRWERSWWAAAREEMVCLFRAPERDMVYEHARRGRFPASSAEEALELTPVLAAG